MSRENPDYVRAAMGIISIPSPEGMSIEEYVRRFRADCYQAIEAGQLGEGARPIIDDFLREILEGRERARRVLTGALGDLGKVGLTPGIENADESVRREVLNRGGQTS